jgi:hypothetical protein
MRENYENNFGMLHEKLLASYIRVELRDKKVRRNLAERTTVPRSIKSNV